MDTPPTETLTPVESAMLTAERSKKWTAEKSGIALTTFTRKVRNGNFTVPEIARIARALGVHPSSLLPPEFFADVRDEAA